MRKKKTGIILAAFFLLILFVLISYKSFFLFQLLFNREIQLKKEDTNINILLLGTGGGTHQGPDLTDTIIFASINPVQNKVVLVSIPRDLWIPDLKAKINSAYAFGNSKRESGGLTLIKSVVVKILNQPIDYGIRINFNGFKEAVDLVGGLDVNVERAFDDFEYPIEGSENDLCGRKEEELKALATASSQLEAFPCRYTSIHLNKGIQNMDGETALQFVRSRHAAGAEGTDFARSKRQGELINAIKDKVISLETLLNPAKIVSLYSVVKDSVDTNIKEDELDDFIRLAGKTKNATLQNVVLDYGDEGKEKPGLLMHPEISDEYNNEWVLVPRVGNGNFSEIQKYVVCEIKVGSCPISQAPIVK